MERGSSLRGLGNGFTNTGTLTRGRQCEVLDHIGRNKERGCGEPAEKETLCEAWSPLFIGTSLSLVI